MSAEEKKKVVPRVVFFGGKAAPGYYMAKLIIQLINAVAVVVNADTEVGDLLKVIFIPNYCVSLAEIIIPASDLSQHISTAGTEASGTSNMKFAMNGCLIIGTLDGANIEIRKEIGEENMFIFGAKAHEVNDLRKKVREQTHPTDPRFTEVLNLIESGVFGKDTFTDILNSLRNGGDFYLLAADFPSYIVAQNKVDSTFRNTNDWTRKSMLSTAGCGKFSSDRTIMEYAQRIWNIKQCRRPGPISVSVERFGTLGLISKDVIPSPSTSPTSAISLERMTPTDRLSVSPRVIQKDYY